MSRDTAPASAHSLALPLPLRLRTMAVAATLAVAVAAVSLPAAPAHAADDRPADPGVRCAAKIGPGEYEFYMPGAKVTDVNGNKWVCGPDGQWFRDYSAVLQAPKPIPGTLPELSAQATTTLTAAALR
jgi:hypothetical protein